MSDNRDMDKPDATDGSNIPELSKFPVQVPIDVAWGEMDAFQHVNNVVYFRYFETARIRYNDLCGLAAFLEGSGLGPILHSVQCRYRAPLTYPDRILSCARVTEIGADRLVMEHAIYSTRLARIAAEGSGVVVTFDYRRNRKAALPQPVREKILQFEPARPRDYDRDQP